VTGNAITSRAGVGRVTITRVIEVPPVVRAKAAAAGAHAWLDRLPELVAGLERDWRITAGRPYTGGTEAYVAAAVRADGTPAVLKLMIPRAGDDAANEIAVLRRCGGEGCAEPGTGARRRPRGAGARRHPPVERAARHRRRLQAGRSGRPARRTGAG